MKSTVFACCLMVLATPVFALSCRETGPAQMFNSMAASPQNYVLALGTFWRDAVLTPDEYMQGQATFTFDGILLSADAALDQPFEQELTAYWVSRRPNEPQIGGDDRAPPPYAHGEQAGPQALVFLNLDEGQLSYTDQLCLPNPIYVCRTQL
ncbi:hypothetical protein SAMN06273572_102298 [Monaibacterium marinum]|uniref:Uncharacterized protein n=1 Tax=Pontivivens marinum TaxID=1690039 RepID=A0A2C9CQ16_9RHOB|nr:hypothetical protein [Monaibacterium marinum]SOH93621.1 hypothetical protein SAMN06273572_102298 [Monaibacterium marinum]